ncbi:MAG TPA: NPCBM/NEW2 domain-containing protein, partial [Puia sp.]|nr:NPCBM/NEW2 domain-containing protein [Puia sp.]
TVVYSVMDRVPVRGQTELRLETTGSEKNIFCLADWVGARLISAGGAAGDVVLSRMEPAAAVQSFMAPEMGRDADYGPLRLDGRVYGDGIGVTGHSELIYELPAGRYSRFEAHAGLDAGLGGAKGPAGLGGSAGLGGPGKILPVAFRVYANDSLLYDGAVSDTTAVEAISVALPAAAKKEGHVDVSPALAVNLSNNRKVLIWDPPEIRSLSNLPLLNLIGGSEAPYVMVDKWLNRFLKGTACPQLPVEAGRPVAIGIWQLKDGSYKILAGNLEEGLSFGTDSIMKLPVVIPRSWGADGNWRVYDEWRGEERSCVDNRFTVELPHAECTLLSIRKGGEGGRSSGGLGSGGRSSGVRHSGGPDSGGLGSGGLDSGAPGNLYKVEDELAAPPEFIPLRIGSVRPEGWLRDWAELAAHGITGHLDEVKETFGKGWTGETFDSAMGADSFGTGWPLEQCAYWLDGLVRLGYMLGDSALIHKARARLDPVVEGVLKGGATFIYWRPKDVLNNEFNSWAHSQMGRALVAYYQATRDPRILQALVKVYRDFPVPRLRNQFDGVSGTVNVDPMLETYLLSGDEAVRQNILRLSQRPDIRHIVNLWNEDSLQPGHGVIYYENIRIPALLYTVTGDRSYLRAAEHTLSYAEKSNLLPMGLISSEEHAAGIGSTRNIETCDVAAGPWTINWLMRLTGRSEYGDRLERIFFNAGPGAIDKDFKTMCYYQSPNRISQYFPSDPIPNNPLAYTYTPHGSDILCCVGNSNRIIPDYIMNMWMRTRDDGLAATLYGPNELTTEVRDVAVSIRSVTTYPFQERISMSVDAARPVAFPLYLRIPAWCDSPVVRVNGRMVPLKVSDRGFARISRVWKKADEVVVSLPMRVRVEQGRETNYPDAGYFKGPGNRPIAMSNKPIDNPYTSIYYGPLLFALPIPAIDPNHVRPGVPSNFALDVGPADTKEVVIRRKGIGGGWKWEIDRSPIVLRVPAVKFPWAPTELQPLPAGPVRGGKATSVELVPYGVTRFRVSMFPVTARAWEEGRGDQ